MVQEVQTWVWVYNETTLETIEAIGTSSFKIVEWRQTKWWHYTSSASASWWVNWDYHSWDERQSPKVESVDMSIWSSEWKAEFTVRDYWLRVPVAWTYQCTVYWRWWSNTSQPTIYVTQWSSKDDEVLYTKTFPSNRNETVTFNVDMWKFDVITIRWSFYYSWSASSAGLGFQYTLTLQQL